MKNFIKETLLPVALIAVIILGGMWFMGKTGLLNMGTTVEAVRVSDSEEYKRLDKHADSLEKANLWLTFRDSLHTNWLKEMDEVIRKKQIKLNYEYKRIEGNSADNNFSELKSIIRSRIK